MSTRVYPLLVVALVFAVHSPALDSGFHYDDQHSLLDNPHIRDLGNIPRFFVDPTAFSVEPSYAMYRPLVLTVHALNYALGGYAPWIYQLTNLVIHCLAALMVFFLLGQWPLAPSAALAGALFFGLHPLQTEAIHLVSSRSESLAALGYLTAFYAHMRGRRPLALASFTAALLCKATAITFPLALALHTWLCGDRASLKRQWPFWALAALYIIAYVGLSAPATGIERSAEVRAPLAQLATQAKALVHYLQLVALPIKLNIQQQFFVSASPWQSVPLLSALVPLSLLALGWRRLPALYGLLFFGIALAPTLILPLHILVNDHRPYLALFGLALGLGAACARKRLHYIWVLFFLYAGLSLQRGQVWRSDMALWRDAAHKAPLMPEAHYNYGYALHRAGDLGGAMTAYQRAIALEPDYARAHSNAGAIYQRRNLLPEAISAYRTALALEPGAVETLNNLGLCYAGLGQYAEALAHYRQALALAPDRADLWLNLGLLLRDSGHPDQAAQALKRALELDPTIAQRHPAP